MPVSLGQFSQAVALIHEAGAAPERWAEALAAIVGLMKGSKAAALMDLSAANVLLRMDTHGHDPAGAKAYSEYYFAIDPTRELVVATPALETLTSYQHFPKGVRARHEYFDFLRRIDVGDVVGTTTPSAKGGRSLISLQRSFKSSEFSDNERALFGLLASHVALAKRIQAELGDAWSSSSRLEAALGRLATAAMIVDDQGRVRHLNAAATALLSRYRDIGMRGDKLTFRDPNLQCKVQAAVRGAARSPGRCAAMPLQLGEASAEVLVAPLQAAHGLVSQWEIPLAFVMIATPQDEKSIAWRMQQLYRLTPAESRIAAQLALGRTVDDIARTRQISDATLRSHLRSIFGKTGTRRQAELVQLALRGTMLLLDT